MCIYIHIFIAKVHYQNIFTQRKLETCMAQKRERERQHVSGVTGNNWEKKRGRIQGADLTPLAGEGLDSL